jgi:magnesium transporter
MGILKEIQRAVDELEISVLRSRSQRMISLNPFKREEHLTDMRRILRSRQSIVMLRKTLAAARGIISAIIDDYDYEGADESSQEIAIYFRDIHDHMGKYQEIVESEDGALTHLMEVQHLVSNYRTNEIIVVLTVLSAVMLPLNLIVGFFGMNFDQFHLYHTSWGIWAVSLSMVGLSAGLIAYFRVKGWL